MYVKKFFSSFLIFLVWGQAYAGCWLVDKGFKSKWKCDRAGIVPTFEELKKNVNEIIGLDRECKAAVELVMAEEAGCGAALLAAIKGGGILWVGAYAQCQNFTDRLASSRRECREFVNIRSTAESKNERLDLCNETGAGNLFVIRSRWDFDQNNQVTDGLFTIKPKKCLRFFSPIAGNNFFIHVQAPGIAPHTRADRWATIFDKGFKYYGPGDINFSIAHGGTMAGFQYVPKGGKITFFPKTVHRRPTLGSYRPESTNIGEAYPQEATFTESFSETRYTGTEVELAEGNDSGENREDMGEESWFGSDEQIEPVLTPQPPMDINTPLPIVPPAQNEGRPNSGVIPYTDPTLPRPNPRLPAPAGSIRDLYKQYSDSGYFEE